MPPSPLLGLISDTFQAGRAGSASVTFPGVSQVSGGLRWYPRETCRGRRRLSSVACLEGAMSTHTSEEIYKPVTPKRCFICDHRLHWNVIAATEWASRGDAPEFWPDFLPAVFPSTVKEKLTSRPAQSRAASAEPHAALPTRDPGQMAGSSPATRHKSLVAGSLNIQS